MTKQNGPATDSTGRGGSPELSELDGGGEPLGLRFDSHEDALDYARHCVERSNNWLASQRAEVAKVPIKFEGDTTFGGLLVHGPHK